MGSYYCDYCDTIHCHHESGFHTDSIFQHCDFAETELSEKRDRLKEESSNGKVIKHGDIVLYGTGCEIVKCVVRKITFSRWHLEVLEGKNWPIGHKFVAKAGVRMWVLSSYSSDYETTLEGG